MNALSDDELVLRCRQGDPDGFAELLYRYKNPLYQYILAMVRDAGAADDIFQDVFLAFYRRLAQYQPEGKLKSYLFTSARNKVWNFFRDGKQEVSLDDTNEDGTAYLQENISGPDPQPLDGLEREETARRIREASLRLPPAQREVIYLKQYMTFKEAAQLLGRPLGTVLADHYRGILKMRKMLQDEA